MELFSFGRLYIGTDNASFNEAFIHIGKLRLELGGPKFKDDGTFQRSINRQTDESPIRGDEEDKVS